MALPQNSFICQYRCIVVCSDTALRFSSVFGLDIKIISDFLHIKFLDMKLVKYGDILLTVRVRDKK